MRRLDSLYKESGTKLMSSDINTVSAPPPPFTHKKIIFPFYYLYRSLRIVLLMWIMLMVVVLAYPWVKYYAQATTPKNETVVLGISDPTANIQKPAVSPVVLPTVSQTMFYVKKGNLEINAPIIEGTTDEALTKGIGHHPDSVWPNQKGNVVIAGHSFSLDPDNKYGQIFGNLRDLAIGDFVSVTHQNKKYTYKIFKREVISPKDTSLFGKTDNWQLTFYTCDPPKTDWRRLVFQAELVKIE